MAFPKLIPPPPSFNRNGEEHRRQIADYTRAGLLSRLGSPAAPGMVGPLGLEAYTEVTPSDTRPDPTRVDPGSVIYVSDQKELQFSDGTQWVPLGLSASRENAYTVVRKTSNQDFTATWQKITFQNAVVDDGGLWVSPDRIEIPSANPRNIQYISLRVQIEARHTNGDTLPLYVAITANGTNPGAGFNDDDVRFADSVLMGEEGKGSEEILAGFTTLLVPVSGGDYFEAWVKCGDTWDSGKDYEIEDSPYSWLAAEYVYDPLT